MIKTPVEIIEKDISEEEKELYEDMKLYYEKVFRCKVCGKLYGSDMKIDNGICVICDEQHGRFVKMRRERLAIQ